MARQARALGHDAARHRRPRIGKQRSAILGYYEDGPNLVTMAMHGWGAAEPAWWLNLQAEPNALVELKGGTRAVRARAAVGDDPDDYADLRPGRTEVVILEPADAVISTRADGTPPG